MPREYGKHKKEMLRAVWNKSADVRDIGPDMPKCVDPKRRASTKSSFRLFCETYPKERFYMEWSEDHLRVISKIERSVLHGELFALAMPRGSGKTSLCQMAVLWAILHSHHDFVMLVSADEKHATDSLESIKTECEINDLLLEDFPEFIYPIRRLERITKRQQGQICNGQPTYIHWSNKEIAFPVISGTDATGAVVKTTGITGHFRGSVFTRASDGRSIRPSLAIIDDPQTDDSSRSLTQSIDRAKVLKGAVLGLAGPGKRIAGIMPTTVITAGDLADTMLNRELNPEWRGEKTKMVYKFPDNTDLWDQYAEILHDELVNDGDGSVATRFYENNRTEMDKGSEVAWEGRFAAEEGEISALQHAMNLKIRDEAAFFAEYQNEPIEDESGEERLTLDAIVSKTNGLPRGVVPIGAHTLVSFIDVQKSCLYWMVVAIEDYFTTSIIDYGAFPEQRTDRFAYRKLQRTLQKKFPGFSREETIYAALSELGMQICGKEWKREDGSSQKVDRLLIDSGWSKETVDRYCREEKRFEKVVMPSKGVGVRAGNIPWSEYRKKVGEKIGYGWKLPLARKTISPTVRTLMYDTNTWKSFMRSRWLTPMGGRGHLSLWGTSPDRHQMLAEHLLAEASIKTEGHGRFVDEWTEKAGMPDNHLLDCLVGCLVGGSERGIDLAVPPGQRRSRGRKKPLSQIRREKQQAAGRVS